MTALIEGVGIIVSLIALADVVRRPASDWIAADRQRFTWGLLVVVLSVIGVVLYLVFIVPRFKDASGAVDDSFLRR